MRKVCPGFTLSSPLSATSSESPLALSISMARRGVGGHDRVSLRSSNPSASSSVVAFEDSGLFDDDDALWRQARERDPAGDGADVLAMEGTARDSCFAFLCLRAAEKEGLIGEASEREDGEERAEAEEGSSSGGGRRPFLRGERSRRVFVSLGAMLDRPAVASDRAGRPGGQWTRSSVADCVIAERVAQVCCREEPPNRVSASCTTSPEVVCTCCPPVQARNEQQEVPLW